LYGHFIRKLTPRMILFLKTTNYIIQSGGHKKIP
jgi:hypothetical protein